MVLGMVACNERMEETIQTSTEFDSSTITVKNSSPKLTIKGKPYRAVEERERDGKECGCKFCFGLCDVGIEVELDLKDFGLVTDLPNNKADIYLLDNLSNAKEEDEFGVDLDLVIPDFYLNGTGLSELTILQGLYDYTPQLEMIVIDDIEYTSYGRATVDIAYQN